MKKRNLGHFFAITFIALFTPMALANGVGGSQNSTNIQITDTDTWTEINKQKFTVNSGSTNCVVTGSADVYPPIGGKNRRYNLGPSSYNFALTIDNQAPPVSGSCVRSLIFDLADGTKNTKSVADTCIFQNLSQGEHTVTFLANKSNKKTPSTTVDDSSMTFSCSDNLLETASATNQNLTIENNSGKTITVYIGFNNGTMGAYTRADFPVCNWTNPNPYICQFQLGATSPNNSQSFALTKGNLNVAISADIVPWSTCGGGTGLTMAELNLNTAGSDWYDISLVNGFNYSMTITPSSGNAITVTSEFNNQNNPGVFPAGCDICTGPQNPPTGSGCPGSAYPQEGHVNAQPPCLYTQPTVSAYTVSIF